MSNDKEREADALIRRMRDVLDESRSYIGAPTFSPSMDGEAAVAVELADQYLAGRASLAASAGSEPADLDAWECERCHGKGWHWKSESVNHGKEIGVENVDLKTHCDACEGSGWCGPDADRAAEAAKQKGESDLKVRGYLAATLKCWHRLTGDEAAELVAMTQRLAGLYQTHPSPPEGMVGGWRPIETAPKDGVAVLVMRDIWPGAKGGRAEECNGHNTYVAAWWSGERGGQGAWVCYMDAVCDPICPIEPTHWMPLPAPPLAAGGGREADHG